MAHKGTQRAHQPLLIQPQAAPGQRPAQGSGRPCQADQALEQRQALRMAVDQLRGSAFPKRAVAWEEAEQSSGEAPPPGHLGETSPLPPLVSEVSRSAMAAGGLRACHPSPEPGASPSAAWKGGHGGMGRVGNKAPGPLTSIAISQRATAASLHLRASYGTNKPGDPGHRTSQCSSPASSQALGEPHSPKGLGPSSGLSCS